MILEIIELRTLMREDLLRESRLLDLISYFEKENLRKNNNLSFQIYINAAISTDLSIHINHSQNSWSDSDMSFVYQIKTFLEKWGLVNHTIWKENKLGEKDDKKI